MNIIDDGRDLPIFLPLFQLDLKHFDLNFRF